MLTYNTDGTITATFDTIDADENLTGTRDVTMRRARLRDLKAMWERFDRVIEEQGTEPVDGENVAKGVLRRYDVNEGWYREAFKRFAGDDLADVDPPTYFGALAVAGEMLRHWQDVPLDRGDVVTQATGGPVTL